MRALVVATAFLGMVISLQAKETDPLRRLRGTNAAAQQLVSNHSGQRRGLSAKKSADGRQDRFSAEGVVPDICTGC